MKFLAAELSSKGPRRKNEDSVCLSSSPDGTLAAAVADGLGGHFGGEKASRLAVERFCKAVSMNVNANLPMIAEDIHAELKAMQSEDPQVYNMATTLSGAVFHENEMRFVHCGDSRIVVARKNGIKRITTDQTEAQRLFAAGKLTREQLANYPRKNILESALGVKGTPRIEEGHFRLEPKDKIFLTSDGLHMKILIRELQAMAQMSETPDALISLVRKEMPHRNPDDNYTIVSVFVSK